MRRLTLGLTCVLLLTALGCQTASKKPTYGGKTKRWDTRRGEELTDLPTPEWWYARRVYDKNYMHWGKMRHPDAGSKAEKWVLLDEKLCKAPHRSLPRVSSDDGREYRFYGYFSDNPGYEPASDEVCPIFVLQRWEPLHGGPGGGAVAKPAAGLPAEAFSGAPPPSPE